MKTKQLFTLALVGIMFSCLATVSLAAPPKMKMITQKPEMKMTTPIPENITTSAKVKTQIGTLEFFAVFPSATPKRPSMTTWTGRGRCRFSSARSLRSPPTRLLQGSRDVGAPDSNQVLVWEQLGDSRSLVLTYNNTSLYTWSFLDLEKDGPTVVEAPPDVLGVFDDGYTRVHYDDDDLEIDVAIQGPLLGIGWEF
jgi:hypothetical protein